MVANECRRANDPNVGLSLSESDAYIKCYLGDTGLLVSHAFDENELLEDEVYKQILAGKLGINEGMLFENAVAQMLTANGHRLFFYTQYNEEKKRNDIEIDFIISNNSKTKYKIYPIEVKSGMLLYHRVVAPVSGKIQKSNRRQLYCAPRNHHRKRRCSLHPALYGYLS